MSVRRFVPRVSVIVLVLAACALGWFASAPQLEVVFTRHILLYRAETVSRALPSASPSSGSGALTGSVRDQRGNPLAGATVVAARADGRAYTVVSDAAGSYMLNLPVGLYTPMATKSGYDDATLAFLWFKRRVMMAPGETAQGDFVLRRATPHILKSDSSVRFLDDTMTRISVPRPAEVRRRAFTFASVGATLSGSYVYEPLADGRYPILLFIYPCWEYPCSSLGWDVLSATMAAEGFVVVAFSPQRVADLEADMTDILKLLAHTRDGHLSAKGDSQKVALLSGSLTSIHLWRVVQLAPEGAAQAAVALGGISDLFLIRQRWESGELKFEPQFAEALTYGLIGLGRPNVSPELYVRYAPVYHLDALAHTPIAIIHGGGDTTVPFEQAEHFSRQLTARGIAHTTYLYPSQDHYLDLLNIGADELDMLEKVTGFLRSVFGVRR